MALLWGCGDGATDNSPAGAVDAGAIDAVAEAHADVDVDANLEVDAGSDADLDAGPADAALDADSSVDANLDVTPPEDAGPPSALLCLSKWYGGEPVSTGNGWVLRFSTGTEIVFDDGVDKSFDELLASPDLQDTLFQPYTPGPIVPVTTLNEDPGRFRNEPLFLECYGQDEDSVYASTETVELAGQMVRVHTKVADALRAVAQRLEAEVAADPSLATFLDPDIYGWNWRYIANTNRLSMHSFGVSIDVASSLTEYWVWDNDPVGSYSWHNSMPQAIVDAFEAEWFIWGGRWSHYDTMHFEFRPELFDPDCSL